MEYVNSPHQNKLVTIRAGCISVGSFRVLHQRAHELLPRCNSLWLICSFLFQGPAQFASSESSCAGEARPCSWASNQHNSCLVRAASALFSINVCWVRFNSWPFSTTSLHLWRYSSPQKSLLKCSARTANWKEHTENEKQLSFFPARPCVDSV